MTWFLLLLLFVSGIMVDGHGIVLKPKSERVDLNVPEYVEELKANFPKRRFDGMKILSPERMIAKPGTLQLCFNRYPKSSNEIMEKYISVYLPHRGNLPSTNYTVLIRDLVTGRIIGHQFLPIRESGWRKVPLDRWSEEPWPRHRLISANHSLEIRLRYGGKIFNFEDFYKSDKNAAKKLAPFLLTYFKNKEPNCVKDFVRFEEDDSDRKAFNLPANQGGKRGKRAIGSTSCSFTIQRIYLNLTAANATLISPGNYTTKICTGSCTPSVSMSSNCDQAVYDCCVPSKTQSFVVLYYDKGFKSLVLRQIPNLIVTECACASSIGNNAG